MARPPATQEPPREEPPAPPPETPFSTIEVRVGRLPGRIGNIVLNGGRKVKDALSGAEIDGNGSEIRVNGAKATLETDLKAEDTVLVLKKIAGN